MFKFPPVETADEYGLIGFGADFEIDTLIEAYSNGIFPWPIKGIPEIPWFSPEERTILNFENFNIGERSIRQIAKSNFWVTTNHNFQEVMLKCQKPRINKKSKKRKYSESWITNEMIEAYLALNLAGHAHSVEIYQEGILVGGIYGVFVGNTFSAESMFHEVNNASKAALIGLVEILKNLGLSWLDCQTASPHLEKWGAVEISRADYMKLIRDEAAKNRLLFPKLSANFGKIYDYSKKTSP